MFERFTAEARGAVTAAQEVARRVGHERIGSEHLLAALGSTTGPGGRALRSLRLDGDRLEATLAGEHGTTGLDAAALAAVGIDVEAVRASTDATFGPGSLERAAPARRRGLLAGHLAFTQDAKKALELSLRAAVRLGHRKIDGGHLVLGVTELERGGGPALLRELGVDPGAVRDAVGVAWADRAAGSELGDG
ncbi:Clp protease N-terminal domain-containing protein [Oerskovia flava]|uniref:Clp protease N-terminal domain-containing protein n=1 Tax=Oerskovia flava TaxID=2986422 RepID=UPI00223EC86A|nr:Clp protease N-terminal domain-containing protein [Oerskovia sp. JB1-3-2]